MAILGRIEHLLNRLKKHKPFRLIDYLDPACVSFIEPISQLSALQPLIANLYRTGHIHEKIAFTQSLIAREAQASTAIGEGIAVPHTRSSKYDHFFLSIGIVKSDAFDWDSEHRNIHFIFLIGGPDNRPTEYLELLAHLTAAVSGKHKREALLACATPSQVIEHLSKY